MDFTLKTYKKLLEALKEQNYNFQTFREFIEDPEKKCVVMRHDVDRLPENSLVIAEIEARSGVRGSYYFRMVKDSFDEGIIKAIAGMGHEIGYHYENLSSVAKNLGYGIWWGLGSGRKKADGGRLKAEGLYSIAVKDFKQNLDRLRKICPIKTICMHGSPTSKYDNRDIWKRYNYRDYGIIGEPYFDIDFNEVFYITDTGRRWDGEKFNIRDKVSSQRSEDRSQESEASSSQSSELSAFSIQHSALSKGNNSKLKTKNLALKTNPSPITPNRLLNSFHSTFDIINALEKDILPDKIMITTHPQRWTDDLLPWIKELVWQNMKNFIKLGIRR